MKEMDNEGKTGARYNMPLSMEEIPYPIPDYVKAEIEKLKAAKSDVSFAIKPNNEQLTLKL